MENHDNRNRKQAGGWVSWFEADGRAHHYPADSERGRWIVDQLAEATSIVCSAPGCETRFVPTRKGHTCCSSKCTRAVSRERNVVRARRDADRVRAMHDKRSASTYRESDSTDKQPISRPDYQDVRAEFGPVIADTADTDRRCANCGRDIGHKRAGAVVCGDTCRKALTRQAARGGEQLVLDLADLEAVEL